MTTAAPPARAARNTAGESVGNRLWTWTISMRSRRTIVATWLAARRDQIALPAVRTFASAPPTSGSGDQTLTSWPFSRRSRDSSSRTRFSPDAGPER